MDILHRKLEKALSFSSRDWLTFFQAWIFLLFVDLGFRCVGFNRIQRYANRNAVIQDTLKNEKSTPSFDRPGEVKAKIEHSLMIVDLAIHKHLYPMTCLRRALTIQWLLKRQRINTEMRFGVFLFEGKLQAHAWLEHDGLPVSDPEVVVERFTPLKGGTTSNFPAS